MRIDIQLEQRTRTVTMAKAIAGPTFEQVGLNLNRFYLVESEGELLFVTWWRKQL
jgi:hypothetical protein